MSSRGHFRTIIVGGLLSAFLLALGLAVAPQLHERFHENATQQTHECAVTLIAAGKCEQASVPLQPFLPQPALHFAKVPALHSIRIPALFLRAAIFEHAPPFFA